MEKKQVKSGTETRGRKQPLSQCYQLMYACTVLIRLLVITDAENPLVLPDLDCGDDLSARLSEPNKG